MWLMGCLNPCKFEKSFECSFLKVFTHMNTKSALKTIFIIGLQSWLLGSMANPALNGQIGRATHLITLTAMDEYFFDANFVFIWVKTFRKVYS